MATVQELCMAAAASSTEVTRKPWASEANHAAPASGPRSGPEPSSAAPTTTS